MSKGDTPRPVDWEKWQNAPFWRKKSDKNSKRESDGDAAERRSPPSSFKHKPQNDCVGSQQPIDWDND